MAHIGGDSFVASNEQKPFSSMSPSSVTSALSSSGGKCILRQPKLKFHTSTTLNSSNNSDGPFSFSINHSITSTNTIGESQMIYIIINFIRKKITLGNYITYHIFCAHS